MVMLMMSMKKTSKTRSLALLLGCFLMLCLSAVPQTTALQKTVIQRKANTRAAASRSIEAGTECTAGPDGVSSCAPKKAHAGLSLMQVGANLNSKPSKKETKKLKKKENSHRYFYYSSAEEVGTPAAADSALKNEVN